VTDRGRKAVLATGDAASIVLFAVVGLLSHDEGVTASGLARNAVPILAVAAAAAPLFGTYRRPGVRTLLPTWAVGVLGGLLVRKAVFGRPEDMGELPAFAAVTAGVTLAFLLAWRAVASRSLRPARSAV
jgi:Protein of unknown function (DUF3054)